MDRGRSPCVRAPSRLSALAMNTANAYRANSAVRAGGANEEMSPLEETSPPQDASTTRRPSECDDPDEIRAGALDGLTVLLVEDDALSREALELILQYYGAHVLSTTSVREALDCFEHSSPTVVVSDIGLPLQDGFSLLRSIRARERQGENRTPAIAISGFPSGETADRARRAGFDAFLRKPINIRTLLHLVCSLASHH
jgi:CheY-like chemotaxis protein